MTSDSTGDFVSALKSAPDAVSPNDAVNIVTNYMQVLGQDLVQGTHVLDSAALPHSKVEIFRAASLLMSLSRDAEERETLTHAARALAFFQPDLGGTHAPLEESRSDDENWDSVVKSEMQLIEAALLPTLVR